LSASVLDASTAKSGLVVVDPAVSAAASESVVLLRLLLLPLLSLLLLLVLLWLPYLLLNLA